jgi:Icc protein
LPFADWIIRIFAYIKSNNCLLLESVLHILHNPDQPISLVQLTDTHLGADVDSALLGMNTGESLDHVLDLIEREQRDVQLLLCTGDLSNNGSVAAYQRFQEKIGRFSVPSVWLMGNHDLYASMEQVCRGTRQLAKVVEIGRWQIVLLDSSIPGKVEGKLAESEMQFLEEHLRNNSDYYQLICLHHHVLPVGCAWLDSQRIANADALLALLSRHRQVRAVLSGHVHQVFEKTYQDFQVLTSPSTCIQFARASDTFKIDTLNPGYRALQLMPDGKLSTSVSRVTGITFQVDCSTQGYD